MEIVSIHSLKFKIMKLSKLNLSITCVIIMSFALIFTTACNNSKEPDKTGNENNVKTSDTTATTTNTTTTQSTSKMNAVKKTGKVSAGIPPVNNSGKMETDKMGYYNYTETAPSFTGGHGAVEDYINNNIHYPEAAIDNGAEGTVNVMFTIDENGKVGNAKTTGTAIGYGLEDEAIRVVNGMSNWTPGMIKGKKVKAWYTLPITFRLE
jgi:protein TonB